VADLLAGWTVEQRLPARLDRVVVRARRGPGGPVVVKATAPGATWRERAALRHEGRVLDRLRHPGVVELLDLVDTRGRTALVLAFVPLPFRPGTDVEPLRAAVDRLAEAGLAHGAIRPEHVLVTADGAPVLCGFGSAHAAPGPTGDHQDLARLARA
jgi:hypothetical protein